MKQKDLQMCAVCSSKFLGSSRAMYCSTKCKSIRHNNNTYQCQKTRGESRKRKLIELSGGGCKLCGYNKCIAALSFHHRNPKEKSFNLDVRSISNRSIEVVMKEFDKCDLLCVNCHFELHYLE